jgi:uncharacterized protein (TIGR00369 family)
MPLARTLGIRADEYTSDRVVLSLDWRPELCTAYGILHGGVVMALADSAGGACALLNLPEDASGTTTIESKTNFLGAAPVNTRVTAESTPLHRGKTTQVWQTMIRSEAGKLCAVVTQTQMVLPA